MNAVESIAAGLSDATEELVARALDVLLASSDREATLSLARQALASAVSDPASMQYGPRMMIAGAAAARAASLSTPAEQTRDDDGLLAALNRVQEAIDLDQLGLNEALDRFASLGAELGVVDRRAFLDFEVTTAHDDAVFLWASGAAALARRSVD